MSVRCWMKIWHKSRTWTVILIDAHTQRVSLSAAQMSTSLWIDGVVGATDKWPFFNWSTTHTRSASTSDVAYTDSDSWFKNKLSAHSINNNGLVYRLFTVRLARLHALVKLKSATLDLVILCGVGKLHWVCHLATIREFCVYTSSGLVS